MWRAAHRVLRAAALIRSRIISPRRDARAAESDGLENHCGASHRGFKSHSLRQVMQVTQHAPHSIATPWSHLGHKKGSGVDWRPIDERESPTGAYDELN